MQLERPHLHAGDLGHIGGGAGLELADDVIVAQIDQADRRLVLAVQLPPGRPGDGLGLHGLAEPLRAHHVLRHPAPLAVNPPQIFLHLPLHGHLPPRQKDPVVQKGDLIPGQRGDLLPQKPLEPRQAQNGPGRVFRIFLQQPAHGRLIRPVDGVCSHMRPPLSRWVTLVMQATKM